mgnify:CR=1 FL=1
MANGKKKILLVEDDAAISVMYKGKLEADGFEVFAADNGATGLELARKEKPDIVMLDIIIPQLDGFSVLGELKKDPKTKNIPVIMLTNLGTNEDKAKGEKMGAVDYLVKASLTPGKISEKIKQILK